MTDPQAIAHIELPLKGPRNYIHSTDMWNAIVDKVVELGLPEGGLRINVRSVSAMNLRMVPTDQAAGLSAIGDVLHHQSGSRWMLVEALEEASARSDEVDQIVKSQIILKDDSVDLPGDVSGTPVEALIAAMKFLMKKRVPEMAKWLAVTVDLPIALRHSSGKPLKVLYKSAIGDKAFFSDVLDDAGQKIGQLAFIGVDAETFKTMEAKL